jgi:hypothetical protein
VLCYRKSGSGLGWILSTSWELALLAAFLHNYLFSFRNGAF